MPGVNRGPGEAWVDGDTRERLSPWALGSPCRFSWAQPTRPLYFLQKLPPPQTVIWGEPVSHLLGASAHSASVPIPGPGTQALSFSAYFQPFLQAVIRKGNTTGASTLSASLPCFCSQNKPEGRDSPSLLQRRTVSLQEVNLYKSWLHKKKGRGT